MPPHHSKAYMSICLLVFVVLLVAQAILLHGWRKCRNTPARISTEYDAWETHDDAMNTIWLETNNINKKRSDQHETSNPYDKSGDSSDCSCLNPQAAFECCQRVVHSWHRMGFDYTRNLFRTKALEPQQHLSILFSKGKVRERLGTTADYREVIVGRDVYDAIVSGYLYHKSGRECWLDSFGKPVNASLSNDSDTPSPYFTNGHWERYVTRTKLEPAKNGRSLCTYLQDESVLDGLRVYMDVAFGRWYNNLENGVGELGRESLTRDRTLILCYEELSDPDASAFALLQMLEWLYPGADHTNTGSQTVAVDKEDHSTSSHSQTWQELKDTVAWLDQHLFQDMAGSVQRALGCSDDLPRVKQTVA